MSILSEVNGKPSSTRVLMLLWGVGAFVVWAIMSIKALAMQPVPPTVLAVIMSFGAQKILQKPSEGK